MEFNTEGDGDFDMLYHFGSIDDIWLGNWGLIRSFKEKVDHLQSLPDRNCPSERERLLPVPTGKRPPKATDPGDPCLCDAYVRKYSVAAIQTPIVYNKAGDHDPHGIMFALEKDVPEILCGALNPEPLILRGNVGDCIEVTLHNMLPENLHNEGVHGYPSVPVEAFFPSSSRISLHTQMLQYDVRGSDGATVGYNLDQTIAPGESITYRWYVDQEYGACNLWDMADLRNHRHHGAFGMFISEKKGSKYLHPTTREEVKTGSQVIISNPILGEFREFVLLMHDGVRLLDKNGDLIVDPRPILTEEVELEDTEDQGSRGFNYRSERIEHRLKENKDVSKVFSSKVHGDPSTPVFLAYPGDPVTIRFVFPSDKPRTHTFVLHGHTWLRNENLINSTIISAQGQNTVGTAWDFNLHYGAGSLCNIPGDYMYRSGNIRWDIELGMWGIMRVLDKENIALSPLCKIPHIQPLDGGDSYE